MSSPEISNYLEKIYNRIRDVIEDTGESVSVDDNDDSLTIDTDEGPISTTSPGDSYGDTVFGESLSVAPNTSDTVVAYNPSDNEGIGGFTGNGESDGRWMLYINGNEKGSQWTNQAQPNAYLHLDNPIEVDSGDTVELEVENIGLDSADYEAALMIAT